jgi:teichuronic acid biosynthesis glycosyltransferase TuaC
MRILSISTMYPNVSQPISGIFVRNRLEALAKLATLTVVSPIPYFPLVSRFIPLYSERMSIPYSANNAEYNVIYPRFFSVPKILKPLDGLFLAIAVYQHICRMRSQGEDFDIIDAHLAFPEGFAAILLGRIFKKPTTITLRGHDINELPRFPVRRLQVRYALRRADRIFAVAAALKDGAIGLGADAGKIFVSCNGVDHRIFKPVDSRLARSQLGLPGDKRILLSVGYLVERKGFQHLIESMNILVNKLGVKDVLLYIVGGRGGEEYVKPKLDKLISQYGLATYVHFAGARPNDELVFWYNACDLFALMSSKEGWPNVILEAMACGKPVVANRAWGIPEIVCSDDYGCLVPNPPQAEIVAQTLFSALNRTWDKSVIVNYAQKQSWEMVAKRLLGHFEELLNLQIQRNLDDR